MYASHTTKKTEFKHYGILLLILTVVLTSCAGIGQSAAIPQSTILPSIVPPTVTLPALPTSTPGLSGTDGTAVSTTSPAPTGPPPTLIPSSASSASSTPAPAADVSWPQLLREFDVGIPAGNSYNPRAIAIDPGLDRIYVRANVPAPDYQAQGVVVMMDLHTGEVLAVVVTGPDSYSEGQLTIDAANGRLYAVNPGEATCSVLDAATLQEITTLADIDHIALDAQNGLLYVHGADGLRVLDISTYQVVRQVSTSSGTQVQALNLDAAHERLYMLYRDDSGYALALYDTADLKVVSTVSLPGPPDELLPDSDLGRVYLSLNDGVHSLFWILDTDGNVLEQQQLGDWLRNTPLALDPAGDRLFLGRDLYNDYGITIRDLQTGQDIADIPLDSSPNVLAWDSADGQLLVSQTYQNRIVVVSAKSDQLCSSPDDCVIASYPTAINLVDAAVDPSRGRLYVTDSAGWLHVLDDQTGEELARLPAEGRISVDSAHDRVYTGGDGATYVRLFDEDRLQQIAEIQSTAIPVADPHDGGLYLVHNGVYIADPNTLAVTGVISDTLPQDPGFSPNPSAVDAVVDPGSGLLYVIINNGIPGSNNGNYLCVYEPGTYKKVFTDGERSVNYVDVDPTTARAYVSRVYLGGQSTSLLEDGRQYTARLDAVFGALQVDPNLGLVYLSDTVDQEGNLFVLDAANLDVLGSVPVASGYRLRALDPVRGLLYLATREGTVQIWSATGGQLPAATQPVAAELPTDQVGQLFPSADGTTLLAGSLYRSDDGGKSWFYIGNGLPDRTVQQVVVSPDFEHDQTLYAVMATVNFDGIGVWKSTDGGKSWRMADSGLSDLAVTGLVISPNRSGGSTLFAVTSRQGLFRSTNGGTSWVPLTSHYQPADASFRSPGIVVLSPTYDQDRTLFIAHYGLQRSTDGGETWTQVSSLEPQSLALSPDFAADGTIFGWFGAAGLLYSSDYGQTWSAASVGLSLAGFGNGRVIVSPDFAASRTLYFVWTPVTPGTPVQYYRSTDAAQSWQQLSGTPPQGIAPLELSTDGTAFLSLDSSGRLVRWPIDELSWEAAALPSIDQIAFDRIVLSPNFAQDTTMLAVSEGAGILRSTHGGLTWTDTRFPLRMIAGESPQPVFLPSGEILVGTVLGLYRLNGSGSWIPVGGGLPEGIAASTPSTGADGSLRLVVGTGEEGGVFLSTDGGATWTEVIHSLPDGATADDLLLSPNLANDRTAFYMPSWGKPLRTIDGSDWEEFGPPVDSSVAALQISPDFEHDGLVIARFYDNSLWRSEDRGDTWTRIDGPWTGEAPAAITASNDYRNRAVTFSPIFAQDHVLLTAAGDAVYRSTDLGDTWTKVLDLEPGLSQAVFSPDYALDGTLYLVEGTSLHRSVDRGQTWKTMPAVPWSSQDEIHPVLSPTFADDRAMLVWTLAGQVYESTDAGQSWHNASAGLPDISIRNVLFSPKHASDGLIYLLPYGAGLFKQVSGGTWLPITESVQPPQPPVTPTPTPTPVPQPSPPPSACAITPQRFYGVWQQASAGLGCPQEPAAQVSFVEQPFEHGRMFWDSKTLKIYVLLDDGTWSAFDDTFQDGVDPAYDPSLPPPPQQPRRGFGKVWRDELGGPQSAIGWATDYERQVNSWWQQFDHGALIWSDATQPGGEGSGIAYVLYDGGTWQAFPTLQPVPAPTPSACSVQPREFEAVWQQAAGRLGCPQEVAAQVSFAEQPFEHGRMFWDSTTLRIYVLLDNGTWSAYDDTFQEGVDPAYDLNLPPPPRQPVRGFGKVWREQLSGTQAAIGWATDSERLVDAWRQPYDHGLLIWSNAASASTPDGGTAYLLFDNGTWQGVAAPAP